MADGIAEASETAEKKRPLGKMLFLLLNLVFFLVGGGFFLFVKFGMHREVKGVDQTERTEMTSLTEQTPSATHTTPPASLDLVDVSLEPFIVNLSGDSGERLLRVVLNLGVKGKHEKEAIEKRLPQIRHSLIFLLSSKTFDDIRSIQGKYRLLAEIHQKLNDVLGAPLVAKTYFREFIVQ